MLHFKQNGTNIAMISIRLKYDFRQKQEGEVCQVLSRGGQQWDVEKL